MKPRDTFSTTLNRRTLVCVLNGLPVASIRKTGGKLARVGSLKNVNEVTAVALVIHSASNASLTAKGVPRELLSAFVCHSLEATRIMLNGSGSQTELYKSGAHICI